MLRIVPNTNASATARYFDEGLATSDYYAKDAEQVIGRWGGLAAEKLGLQGEVTKEDFTALCDNKKPDGSKLNPREKENRKVGYDFTFSAPKSVSIAYATTNDERIRSAFERSVSETMQELEKDMRTQTGQGKEKKHVQTGNMVWAEFTHFTSRPVDGVADPHLHAHCFAINTTWHEESGRFQAGEFGSIKRDASYYEAAFFSRFAHRMQEMGYGIRHEGRHWELEGIGRSTIEKFSRRTQQVEEAAEKKGIQNEKAKADLGARTREQKVKSDGTMQDLKENWLSRLSDDEKSATQNLKGAAGKRKSVTAGDALDSAVRHSFERKSVMEEKRLLTEALKRGYGDVLPEAVGSALNGANFYRRNIKEQTFLTTEEALQDEKRMVQYVREGRGTVAPINSRYQPKADYLNAEQKDAIRHAMNSTDQVTVISGGAGTGKTTLMKEVQQGIRESGKEIFGFAPSAAASRDVMRKEGFEQADTLAQLLANRELQKQVKNQVIWVDEAGMIGNKDMNRVFEIAKEQNARILLTGDVKQHAAVKAGDALRIIEERGGIKVAQINKIQRQRSNDNYRQVVEMIANDKIEPALNKLDRMGGVVEIADREQRLQALVSDYVDAVEKKKTALVVSPVHREANMVTDAIRERLKSSGKLEGEEKSFESYKSLNLSEEDKNLFRTYGQDKNLVVEFHQNSSGFKKGERWEVAPGGDTVQLPHVNATNREGQIAQLPLSHSNRFTVYRQDSLKLAAGDRLRITKGGKTLEGSRINNGDIFTVNGFDKKGNIRLDSGKTLSKDFGHMAHGYVTTSHSSQGKTVDRVFIAQSEMSEPAASRQQFYVSISRGKEMAKVYTDDKIALEKSVMKDGSRMTASQVAELQKQRTMKKEHDRAVESQKTKSRSRYAKSREIIG
jgi:conjugative relaxase-like TrwC/TraI family protein